MNLSKFKLHNITSQHNKLGNIFLITVYHQKMYKQAYKNIYYYVLTLENGIVVQLLEHTYRSAEWPSW